jgi:hypothetical protein
VHGPLARRRRRCRSDCPNSGAQSPPPASTWQPPLPTSAPGLGSPWFAPALGLGLPLPTSAPGPSPPLSHLHWAWSALIRHVVWPHPCPICAGTLSPFRHTACSTESHVACALVMAAMRCMLHLTCCMLHLVRPAGVRAAAPSPLHVLRRAAVPYGRPRGAVRRPRHDGNVAGRCLSDASAGGQHTVPPGWRATLPPGWRTTTPPGWGQPCHLVGNNHATWLGTTMPPGQPSRGERHRSARSAAESFRLRVADSRASGPGADVGESRRRCGPVPAQM